MGWLLILYLAQGNQGAISTVPHAFATEVQCTTAANIAVNSTEGRMRAFCIPWSNQK